MMRQLVGVLFVLLVSCGGVKEQGDDIPAIEAIVPAVGPQAGGTMVTLTGSALEFSEETATRVIVGTAVVEATVVDDATITFVTPPGASGSADVVVLHGGGATVAPGAFTYAPLPTVTAIQPTLGGEGTTVTVRGTGFESFEAGGVSIEIDGEALASVEVVNDTVVTGVLPAPPGAAFTPVDVTVTTNNGAATLPASFRYTRQGLLALTTRQSGHRVYFVDPDTAKTFFFGNSVEPISQATLAATGEVFVYADTTSRGSSRLGNLEMDGLDVINQVDLSVDVFGGALEIDGADLFFLDRRAAVLRRFNLAGVEQAAPAVTIQARAAPTCIFRRDGTTLFLITTLDGQLSAVNKATGALTSLATLDGPAAHFCHGAARIGSEVFVIGHQRSPRVSRLFRLDTANGNLTEVGVMEDETGGQRLDHRYKSLFPTPPSF